MDFRNFILRLIINMIALVVTATVIPGITVSQEFMPLLVVALIFGIVNALIRPIITLLTCPAVILTLGLFLLVINGFVLQITAYFSGGRFDVNGFWAAFLGGIIIAIVNMVLEGLVGLDAKNKKASQSKKRR